MKYIYNFLKKEFAQHQGNFVQFGDTITSLIFVYFCFPLIAISTFPNP